MKTNCFINKVNIVLWDTQMILPKWFYWTLRFRETVVYGKEIMEWSEF